jgi:hypothetical protein
VASSKTDLTELATAVGLFWNQGGEWPASVQSVEIPGIDRAQWLPVLEPALLPGSGQLDLLMAALSNGRAFRRSVLGGRAPRRVRWTGRDRSVWSSEIPRDLVVDDVWFIQAKHDSTCVLNTSPHSVFELLTAETDVHHHQSWFEVVAGLELQAYYDTVRQAVAPGVLPATEAELTPGDRQLLKGLLPKRQILSDTEAASYRALCEAVSQRTADRWQSRISRATPSQRTRLFLRMMRIAGGPYWLLGTKGGQSLQLRVCDTREWRRRFKLRELITSPATAGQPQVDWQASVVGADGRAATVAGFCEVRWSHGKLQGSPECKVQVTTALDALPGYDPMD